MSPSKKKNVFAQPSTWGASGWRFLHCISLTYPLKPTLYEKEDMWRFLSSVGDVLPCKLCRKNYKTFIRSHPFCLDSRDDLVDWMFRLHNSVNSRLKKKIYTKKEFIDIITRECQNG